MLRGPCPNDPHAQTILCDISEESWTVGNLFEEETLVYATVISLGGRTGGVMGARRLVNWQHI